MANALLCDSKEWDGSTVFIEEREVIRSTEWSMKAPGYVYEEHFIWGATSMILTELCALLKDVNF